LVVLGLKEGRRKPRVKGVWKKEGNINTRSKSAHKNKFINI